MTAREWAAGFGRAGLDLLFPESCLLCGRGFPFGVPRRAPVCPACAGRLAPLKGGRCSRCGLPLVSEAGLCLRCRERSFAFDRHRSLFEYRGEVRELIYYYKFKGRRRLGIFFAELMADAYAGTDPNTLIVPAPSRGRLTHKRGFAPVPLLAQALAQRVGRSFLPCLVQRPGAAQKSLSFEERLANLRGRIGLLPSGRAAAGRPVLLVDDIFTTGATADECAHVLKASGAAAVEAATIAMEI